MLNLPSHVRMPVSSVTHSGHVVNVYYGDYGKDGLNSPELLMCETFN